MAHIVPYRITFNDPYNGCAVFAWLYEPQSILLKGASLRDYMGITQGGTRSLDCNRV